MVTEILQITANNNSILILAKHDQYFLNLLRRQSYMEFALDISTIEILTGGKHRVLVLCKILEYLYRNRMAMTKSQLQELLSEEFDVTPSDRSMHEYLEQLTEAGLIKQIFRNPPLGSLYNLKPEIKEKSTLPVTLRRLIEVRDWNEILQAYNYLPFYQELQQFIQIHEKRLGLDNDTEQRFPVALLETVDSFPGKEHLEIFYTAIANQQIIHFSYQHQFKSPIRVEYFMPYALKEHNRRWYVVGKPGNENRFRVYAMDRILDVLYRADHDEFEREPFDPEMLWKNSMGIYLTWKSDDNAVNRTDAIRISFKVKDGPKYKNIDYLKTSKLHPSQNEKDLTGELEGWTEITLHMFPEVDLVRELRRIGLHCLRDIKPDFLSRWVIEG